jgi:hypothetical protein
MPHAAYGRMKGNSALLSAQTRCFVSGGNVIYFFLFLAVVGVHFAVLPSTAFNAQRAKTTAGKEQNGTTRHLRRAGAFSSPGTRTAREKEMTGRLNLSYSKSTLKLQHPFRRQSLKRQRRSKKKNEKKVHSALSQRVQPL